MLHLMYIDILTIESKILILKVTLYLVVRIEKTTELLRNF